MKLRTINNLDLNGKKILLRVDLNSDVVNSRVLESERIKAHAETIKILLKKKAKVVILSHQGSLGKKDCTSLKQHAKLLNKHVRIKFIPEVIGKKVWREISALKNGNAVLLENVRFLKDEFTPSVNNQFVNFMKEIGFDYYVNDAFSILHRNQTSIVSFQKVFPSIAGPVLVDELKHAKKLKSKLKNSLFILGGAKTKDLLPLLNQRVLTTGKLSLLVLKARGYKITKENGLNNQELKLDSKIKKHFKNLETPVDLALNVNGKRKEIFIEELPRKHLVLDIGKNTMELYKNEIANLEPREVVFLKGAPGMFEYKEFAEGTRELLNAMAKSKAFSVIAGGQTSDAVRKFRINKKKIGYVSLSGGALVKYLAGEKLVGLEALK